MWSRDTLLQRVVAHQFAGSGASNDQNTDHSVPATVFHMRMHRLPELASALESCHDRLQTCLSTLQRPSASQLIDLLAQ